MVLKAIFLYFAVVILGTGILGITQKNPVKGLLWILVMLVHLGGIYLLLNAEFLAMVQIIVYAGAILVMFLFVIFLLDIKEEEKGEVFLKSWQTRVCAVLLWVFLGIVGALTYKTHHQGPYTIELIEKEGHAKVLGLILFSDYVYHLILLGFILFVPLLGIGLMLLRRKTDGSS
ncbi:NADH-ubiquinone/plastoquinone oxidoreductase chain 6 [Thermodesulfobacterium sp. TA1]|uniref:NADH-quinone oxidoreductase subunit J family protein n=1 Tax=Thermodesulfobacterium sp. TA1 TaxID=2234087 RepID=UPI001232303C|nr:NADH-quinone oxidoreductase subunit J [Thermodesulfobacterium sp. TA1]QER42647.1 NADH-ubiquinone/plastoquinone oxidoreductase chain 6 [Thermodesulfobacterium sp. TA1]